MEFPPLTGTQMGQFSHLSILTVNDLKKPDIPNNFIFIFQNTPTQGHWVLVLQHPKLKTFEFFDPLGMSITDLKPYFNYYIQERGHLARVLFEKINQYHYIGLQESKTPLEHPTGTTCGYIVLYRFLNRHINLEKFLDLVETEFKNPLKEIPSIIKQLLTKDGLL